MLRLKGFGVALLTLFLLNACTMVGPDYKQPKTDIAPQWDTDGNGVKTAIADNEQWWQSFNDPVLNSLIEEGYKNNISLQSTGVKVLQERAALGQSVGELYPQQQGLSASYTHKNIGESSETSGLIPTSFDVDSVALSASWEIDFWGKYRRAIRANDALFLSSIAAYENALVSLTADIGSTYVAIRTYQAQIRVTEKNIVSQKQGLKITKTRYELGQESLSSVQQALTELDQTEASLPGLKINLQKQKDALAVLLGSTPDKVNALLRPSAKSPFIPVAPSSIAVGIPKAVLQQRPDVHEAELQAMAQSEGIGAIKAELYPALSLLGSFGYSSSTIGNSSTSDIFQWSNHTVSIGPSLSLPLFNYGQITNQVREQDAAFQAAILNYQNVVLKAQQEVQDGIISYVESEKTMHAMMEANRAAIKTLQLTLVRYQAGQVDFSDVLNAQQQQLNVEMSLAEAQGSVPQGAISLYRALGGGWQISKGHDVVSEKIKKEMADRTNWGDLLETPNHEAPTNKSEELDQTILPSW